MYRTRRSPRVCLGPPRKDDRQEQLQLGHRSDRGMHTTHTHKIMFFPQIKLNPFVLSTGWALPSMSAAAAINKVILRLYPIGLFFSQPHCHALGLIKISSPAKNFTGTDQYSILAKKNHIYERFGHIILPPGLCSPPRFLLQEQFSVP